MRSTWKWGWKLVIKCLLVTLSPAFVHKRFCSWVCLCVNKSLRPSGDIFSKETLFILPSAVRTSRPRWLKSWAWQFKLDLAMVNEAISAQGPIGGSLWSFQEHLIRSKAPEQMSKRVHWVKLKNQFCHEVFSSDWHAVSCWVPTLNKGYNNKSSNSYISQNTKNN